MLTASRSGLVGFKGGLDVCSLLGNNFLIIIIVGTMEKWNLIDRNPTIHTMVDPTTGAYGY